MTHTHTDEKVIGGGTPDGIMTVDQFRRKRDGDSEKWRESGVIDRECEGER